MTNYNVTLNINKPVEYTNKEKQNIEYQFRAEYAEDKKSALIYRRFSSFTEYKLSLVLLGSVVTAFTEVIAPPCYWMTHKAISCFYREGSANAAKENCLAREAINPWLQERTIYVIPTAVAIAALGLVSAVVSFFVSVQDDTLLFSTIAKIDRWLNVDEDEPYFAPELQPIAEGVVEMDEHYEEGDLIVDSRDVSAWFESQGKSARKIDTEGFEGFLTRLGL